MSYGAIQKSATEPQASKTSVESTQNEEASGRSQSPSIHDVPPITTTGNQEDRDNTRWGRLKAVYTNNIGLFFVFLAQLFGSIVSTGFHG